VAKLIHAMIRVQDLDRSLDFYRRAFALEPGHRLDFPDFTLVYLKNRESEFELELTFNHAQRALCGRHRLRSRSSHGSGSCRRA
jgi:catechol 2,3-dioxygenase-like lactoylglutathione lyase family enzyme